MTRNGCRASPCRVEESAQERITLQPAHPRPGRAGVERTPRLTLLTDRRRQELGIPRISLHAHPPARKKPEVGRL